MVLNPPILLQARGPEPIKVDNGTGCELESARNTLKSAEFLACFPEAQRLRVLLQCVVGAGAGAQAGWCKAVQAHVQRTVLVHGLSGEAHARARACRQDQGRDMDPIASIIIIHTITIATNVPVNTGTGKTSLVQGVCQSLGLCVVPVTLPALLQRHPGDPARALKEVLCACACVHARAGLSAQPNG